MMNKTRFRLLVFFMSLSLIGIILVQLYWINSSLKASDEQFKFHVQQILNRVTEKISAEEELRFNNLYYHIKDSVGRRPTRGDFGDYIYKGDLKEHQNTVYSDYLSQSYKEELEFFDKNEQDEKADSLTENSGENGMTIDEYKRSLMNARRESERRENLNIQMLFHYYNAGRPIESRISEKFFLKTLKSELKENKVDEENKVNIDFEYAIYKNGLATKMRSKNFSYDPNLSYTASLFPSKENESSYTLMVSFPSKRQYILSQILGITMLSVIFTLIIIIAYLSAINQLIKQKQISEIKTDFNDELIQYS